MRQARRPLSAFRDNRSAMGRIRGVALAVLLGAVLLGAVLLGAGIAPEVRPAAAQSASSSSSRPLAASPLEKPAEGQQYALLVGVDQYPRNALLSPLNFPERDVDELARVLIASGYPEKNVRVLTRTRGFEELSSLPTAANIRREIESLLADRHPNDTVLIALAGHGVLMLAERQVNDRTTTREESLFCPLDADLRNKRLDTFISMDLLYEDLAACRARVKFLLCDACRNQAFAAARPGGIHLPPPLQPPQSVAALYACSKQEVAYEDQELAGGHGVFMYFVIQGLRGAADANEDGRVTSFELAEFCGQKVGAHVRQRFGNRQTPELAGSLQSVTLTRLTGSLRGLPPAALMPRPAAPQPPLLIAPFKPVEAKAAQEAWALYLGRKVVEENRLGMKFVLIPPGEFLMGSTEADIDAVKREFGVLMREDGLDEKPQHRVRITRPFYLGQHEVMLGQFLKYYEASGEKTEPERDERGGHGYNAAAETFEFGKQYDFRNLGFSQTADHPVVNVTQNDAAAFCRWLSQQEGTEYNLPSEAQWEYACRAGTTTLFYHGDDGDGLRTVGNIADLQLKSVPAYPQAFGTATHDDRFAFTAPVGSFRPNAFGLHDMHGNVWEWCRDGYDENYYAISPTDDPPGAASSFQRVLRGGGWINLPRYCRSASRLKRGANNRNNFIGFRVALTP